VRLIALALACVLAGSAPLPTQERPPDPVATFSILGFDPATGEAGGAVQSRVFSVGNGVLWAEADVGVVTTQAIVDVSYGPKGLALLRAGMKPEAIVRALLDSDPDPGYRRQPWPKAGRQFASWMRKATTPSIQDRRRPRGPATRQASSARPRGTSWLGRPWSPAW